MDQGAGPPTPFLPPPVTTTNLGARPKEQRDRSAHSSLRGENVSSSFPQPPTPGGIPPPETEESRPRPLTSTPTLEPTSLPPTPTIPPTSHAEHIVDLSTDDLEDFDDNSQQTDARPGTFWSPFRKHTTQSHIDFDKSNNDSSRTNLADDSQDTPTRRPTRHINTNNKLKNWSLSVGKKWVVIGDSNASRLPPFQIPDLQVDSFPGATFRHIGAVLNKMSVNSNVETVVLSLGLNNRTQKVATSIKELQRLIRVAKLKFPQATIWVPLINFSRALPHQEQTNLHDLNRYRSNQNFIPELARSDFTTERDNIHWSHLTAQRLIYHWALEVNC
ncbi:hypothetical protein JOB18_026099 [Solea senegalensis]|uniref:SGNH hydrolase-type esterase domain-containing protein n=1 Tax=Solea senegalensis TaxID=28829 RepID=A0AAV6RK42_SOLSE|nr:hypothetical protein JOB18_015750 [Solea senegalensis]KAG7505224.1 hypothetical protein JOB18_026099 [Solea senegalensis]